MIYIEKDQQLFEDKNLRVYSASGNYDDNYLVEVYDIEKPDFVIGSFAAQYVKYGSVVYRFGNIQELGEEIFKLDPESTHSMAAYVRMQKELLKQATEGSLENNSLDQVMVAEELKTENNPVTGESISASSESLTTPASENPVDSVTDSITTPEPTIDTSVNTVDTPLTSIETNTSTTTESLIIDSISTITPDLETANSTSTVEI